MDYFDRPEVGLNVLILDVQSKKTEFPELPELSELVLSAGFLAKIVVTATIDRPNPKWFVGKGKVNELKEIVAGRDVHLLVVNCEISGAQHRNLEKFLGIRVITRTELIIFIFGERAKTSEGKLQVELAQLYHLQSRLVGGWSHLDRQKGGVGLRGAGERQSEIDKRLVGQKIKLIQAKISRVSKRRETGRKSRAKGGLSRVALVGYTNAGKSTLFNALTSSNVVAEDKLFATLDPTVRRVEIPGTGDIAVSDTVGFISHLPTLLIDSFRATLEEVVGADLLLHVVDASDVNWRDKIQQVNTVLCEIQCDQIPQVLCFNKWDLLAEAEKTLLPQTAVGVSSKTNFGINFLLEELSRVLGVNAPYSVWIRAEDGASRSWLYSTGAVLEESLCDDSALRLRIQADNWLVGQIKKKGLAIDVEEVASLSRMKQGDF